MADAVPGRVDPLSYPTWVVVDSKAPKRAGTPFAVHYLTALDGSGDKVLPVFRTEAGAAAYISASDLADHEVSPVHSADDLLLLLELFRKRSGTRVRIDSAGANTLGEFAPRLGPFIDFIRLTAEG
jgi:hypothetical protein